MTKKRELFLMVISVYFMTLLNLIVLIR